jgi:putative CocE/NonD family hydrolase
MPNFSYGGIMSWEKSFIKRITIAFVLIISFICLASASFGLQEQSTSTSSPVKIAINIRIPMRDGVTLAANIFRPDKPGKFPAIVLRTPYGKNSPSQFTFGRFFAQNDYVYLAVDSRGRHDSEGTFHAMHDEAEDGYDTIEWAATQPWCDGRVGTLGGSYGGENQWMAATACPPHLKTMIVLVSPPGPFYNLPFQYGVLTLPAIDWYIMVSDHVNQSSHELGLDKAIKSLPLVKMDELITGKPIPLWKDIFKHPTYDDHWKKVDFERYWDKIDMPILHISGWYDDDQPGTFRNFTAMRKLGRKGQKLIVGPWPHAVNSVTKLGILDFGPSSQIDLQATLLRWFDRWLKGVENGVDAGLAVRLFVMGANVWRDEADWPIPDTQWTKYYFHSSGKANSVKGDGLLSTLPPKKEPPDNYTYDPADPTPFIMPVSSAQVGGPDDYSQVGERNDILVYTSPPLDKDMEITGPITVKLYASSSAPDTDWHAMLLDVYPEGYAIRLNDGIIRASYRESFENPSPIEPGKIYEYTIDCWNTSMVIKRGHRLRVHIASAAFPKFARNQNTGHPYGLDDEIRVAQQTIYHDAKHPSHIILPVIPERAKKN